MPLTDEVAALPDHAYALAAVLFWASSVPVINAGLREMPSQHRYAALIGGLAVAMIAGTLVLRLISGPVHADLVSFPVVMAGVLTFPIATGGYYLAAALLGERTEVASQFAKLKPLFSIALAVILLGESTADISMGALVLLVAGLMLLSFGIVRQRLSLIPLAIGLGTALAWAVGELFVKIGFRDGFALQQTLLGLAISTLLVLPVALPAIRRLRAAAALHARWLVPFALHGVLSFGLGYGAFFHSITRIGLSRSVIITAFWPVLGILFTWLYSRIRSEPYRLHPAFWAAALLLLAASLLQMRGLVSP